MDSSKVKKPSRLALGRGLSALISGNATAVPIRVPDVEPTIGNAALEPSSVTSDPDLAEVFVDRISYVDPGLISANPFQPRQKFKEEEIQELADSVRTLGVLQPVLVRHRPENSIQPYELVAGERRLRAARLAGAAQIPVIIKEIDDSQSLQIALVENIQRSNLNVIEEAQAYNRLTQQFALSQQEIAERVGKDRATIANLLRLLKLPDEVRDLVQQNLLTLGHAKAILTIKEPSAQISLAKKAVKDGLTVRALEALVSNVVVLDAGRTARKRSQLNAASQSAFPEIADRLRNVLGTKVIIKHHPSGNGRVEIEYFSEQDLDRIVETICR